MNEKINSNDNQKNNYSTLKKLSLISFLILIIMLLKKFFTITTIGVVTLGSAVGISIGLKSINSTSGSRPGSDYVKVFEQEDKGKNANYVDDSTWIYIDKGAFKNWTPYIAISEMGWASWYPFLGFKAGKYPYPWKGSAGSFAKKYFYDVLVDFAANNGKTLNVWSWYRENIPGGDKLPSEFYFDTASHHMGTPETHVPALWVPNSWLPHDEKTEENVHYDAPVSDFHVDSDKHQYHLDRERKVSTNSYWYEHRDKVKQYQEK